MELHQVASSVISAIGYDGEQRILEVRFHNGRIYHYYDVPRSSFERLLAARSAGQYFNRVIRVRFRAQLVYDPELTPP
jgi:hypothetical protein